MLSRCQVLGKYDVDNITAACAVDREFAYIVGPVLVSLGAFGSILGSMCLPQAPFGSLWSLFG